MVYFWALNSMQIKGLLVLQGRLCIFKCMLVIADLSRNDLPNQNRIIQ